MHRNREKVGETLRLLNCECCGSSMRMADRIHSGNSIYIDWQCTKCMNRKQLCEGISPSLLTH